MKFYLSTLYYGKETTCPCPVSTYGWYQEQCMRVEWNQTLSDPFSVSNGVRQGGVFSPILFNLYRLSPCPAKRTRGRLPLESSLLPV